MEKGAYRNHLLRLARKRLGLPPTKRAVLAQLVADSIGCQRPNGREAQYRFLAHYLGNPELPQAQPKRPAVPKKSKPPFEATAAFLLSYEWRTLRMQVLVKRGPRCECCGATPKDGIRINVDHIKPRRKHPELALVESNLQVLCDVCNQGKGNWNETDWRADVQNPGSALGLPLPGTATATSIELALRPRLVRRS